MGSDMHCRCKHKIQWLIVPAKSNIKINWRLLILLASLWWFPSCKNFQQNRDVVLPIKQVAAIRGLPPDMAGRNLPVSIKGVVTFYDPVGSRLLFIQDESQGIYVNPLSSAKETLPIVAGSLVQLEGLTSRGTLHPAIYQPMVKVLGKAAFPAPVKSPLSQLMDGKQDCQWVETEGVVRSVGRLGAAVVLGVADQQAFLQVIVLNFPEAKSGDLVDARIQLRGVLGTHSNVYRQVVKVQLFVPDGRQIRILESPGQNPFEKPVVSIGSLQRAPRTSFSSHRLRLQGRVFPRQLGEMLLMRDSTGSLEVFSHQTTPVNSGDEVDAVGFPAIRENKLVLEDSLYRRREAVAAAKTSNMLLPVLTQAEAIRQLKNPEAAKGYPVRLQGILTYADVDSPTIFIEDQSSGIIVEPRELSLGLKAGQRVELEGTTAAGEIAPLVVARQIRSLGGVALPAARPTTIDRFFRGEVDSLRVELEGIVRTVYGDANHAFLELENGGIRFLTTIPNYSGRELPLDLVDARVRIRGSAGIHFNLRRQISGYQLYTPGIQEVLVLETPPVPPFSLPIKSIQDLMRFTPGELPGHRVRIHGEVLHNRIGRFLYLRDSSGTIFIQTRQEMGILPGTPIDVAGFPAIGDPANILEDAVIQWPLPAKEPRIDSVTASQALSGNFHGDLVRLQGELIDWVKTSSGQTLIMKSEDTIFEASLDEGAIPASLLEEGCRLDLTGICLVKNDKARRTTFQLLLRSGQDIRLLKGAPWWTPVRLAWMLGLFIVGISISFAWGFVLRRRVREQTQIIRQKLEREAALEKEYQDLFEHSNDVVFSFDLHGPITSINKAGEKLLGYTRDELKGKTFSQLVCPEQLPLFQEKIGEIAGGAPSVSFEIALQSREGNRVILEVTGDAKRPPGKSVALRGIGRDITLRKRAEAALHASEERLRQKMNLEAIGTLAGGIAHDFNNILSAILGYAELSLMELDDTARISENLSQIHKAGRRARDLVRQILAFSRKLDHERCPILIQPLLEDAVNLLRATLPSTIELQLEVDPDCQPVLADSSQLHQVIMNLGTNALHAMRSSGGRLEFRLRQMTVDAIPSVWNSELEKGEYNCLTVSDTGHGIDSETLKRIFEPYFTTKQFGDGSGLGLAVVHGIVQSHKGAIRVESRVGEGAIFQICFPCHDEFKVEAEMDERELSGGEGNILFIDDEVAIVNLMEEALNKLGYSVTPMTDSVEALTIFQQCPQSFDLVITDQTMPRITGINLAHKLRTIRPKIPIILCTGFSEDATPEKALLAGVSAHFYKPVSIQELAETIQKFMAK